MPHNYEVVAVLSHEFYKLVSLVLQCQRNWSGWSGGQAIESMDSFLTLSYTAFLMDCMAFLTTTLSALKLLEAFHKTSLLYSATVSYTHLTLPTIYSV